MITGVFLTYLAYRRARLGVGALLISRQNSIPCRGQCSTVSAIDCYPNCGKNLPTSLANPLLPELHLSRGNMGLGLAVLRFGQRCRHRRMGRHGSVPALCRGWDPTLAASSSRSIHHATHRATRLIGPRAGAVFSGEHD
jgi:hypothetical protein